MSFTNTTWRDDSEFYGFNTGPSHDNSRPTKELVDQVAPRSTTLHEIAKPEGLHCNPVSYHQSYAPVFSRERTSSNNNGDMNYISSYLSPELRSSKSQLLDTRQTNLGMFYDRTSFGAQTQSSKPRRYYCDHADCVDENGKRRSISRKADLKRHMLSVHGPPHIDCEFTRCERKGDNGFRRLDHYHEHLRGFHNEKPKKSDRRRDSDSQRAGGAGTTGSLRTLDTIMMHKAPTSVVDKSLGDRVPDKLSSKPVLDELTSTSTPEQSEERGPPLYPTVHKNLGPYQNHLGVSSLTVEDESPAALATQAELYSHAAAVGPGDSAPTDSGYASRNPDRARPSHLDQNSDYLAQQPRKSADAIDGRTVYSHGASVETSRRDSFAEHFAELIFKDLGVKQLDKELVNTVCEGLRDLLADFALRLGQESSSAEVQKAMVFIHKYRSLVGRSLEILVSAQTEDEDEIDDNASGDKMALGELMQMWCDNESKDLAAIPDSPQIPDIPGLESHDETLSIEDLTLDDAPNELDKYVKLVTTGPSYQWLIAKLRNKLLLSFDGSSIYHAIRSKVLENVPKLNVVQCGVAVSQVDAIFRVEWPLRKFLEDQLQTSCSLGELGKLVTLTGTATEAQALPCSAYLQQTWPTTGIYLMQLLETTLQLEDDSPATCQRPDGTYLRAWCQSSTYIIQVFGGRDVVAEVAEQLSWISAALRSPTSGQGLTYCVPSLYYVQQSSETSDRSQIDIEVSSRATGAFSGFQGLSCAESSHLQPNQATLSQSNYQGFTTGSYTFDLCFEFHRVNNKTEEGDCWRFMFQNPVIVKGYPIRKRPRPNLGLEVPLNVMAGLVGTKYVNEFCEDVFVKGFSSMLIPTNKIGNVVVWHLYSNEAGSHIAYTDYQQKPHRIQLHDLEEARHIVGWCTKITNLIGTIEANDCIDASSLRETRPGYILDNSCLNFGKAIKQEPSFELLRCHKSLHVASGLYFSKLDYLAQHFALLWDVNEDRGWLTNSLSAFLHLIKASIRLYDGPIGARLYSNWQRLQSIACSIWTNRSLVSFETFSDHSHLHSAEGQSDGSDNATTVDEVAHQIFTNYTDQLYDAVDKMITLQEKVEHEDRRTVGRTLRVLEGWDYADLTNQYGPKRPRMMILPTVAFTWAKWIRSLNTVTLFGQGFGDLLSPSMSCAASEISSSQVPQKDDTISRCHYLPVGKFYIAAAIRDLKSIIQEAAMNFPGHILLNNTAVLSNHRAIFASCKSSQTKEPNTRRPVTFVQMPWPMKHKGLLSSRCQEHRIHGPETMKAYLNKFSNGAVMFGHDPQIGWYIDDTGGPLEGTPPNSSSEVDDLFDDSGIGSSLSATLSRENGFTTRPLGSENHQSLIESSLFPSDKGQAYGNSTVSGGQPVYGNVYNVTNNSTIAATQNAYLNCTRSQTQPSERLLDLRPQLEIARHGERSQSDIAVDTMSRSPNASCSIQDRKAGPRKRKGLAHWMKRWISHTKLP